MSKTTELSGMKRPVCASCFEYPENCIGCEWHNCAMCNVELSDSEAYEYRGAIFCAEHHEEGIKLREEQRARVAEEVEHSVYSQRAGEFVNNHHKYGIHNVAADGLPIVKVKEPQSLKDYEEGKL